MRRLPALPVLLALGACATSETAPRISAPRPVRMAPPPPAIGLARAIGQDAAALAATFGPPALDLREGPARKLQYRGAACILDIYLYPPATGGEPRATYVDARTPRGDDTDRAACIEALVRR